jgi:hypothetical protein
MCLFAATFGCTSFSPPIIVVQGIPAFIAVTAAILDYDETDNQEIWFACIYGAALIFLGWGHQWKVKDTKANATAAFAEQGQPVGGK